MKELTALVNATITSARPVHWIKNFALFAAPVLTGTLVIRPYFVATFWAFIAFNFATSAGYMFNDVIDAKRDRLHPIKKNRSIAKGVLPKELALTIALGLAVASLYLAINLNTLLFWIISIYLFLQIIYNLGLKRIVIIDIIIIASGFVLRVYAGAFVINAHLSAWFLLTVISVALFLASGKRRSELAVSRKGATRESLSIYTKELLNSYVTMFGNAAWISWSLYTFFESPKTDLSTLLYLADISKATTIGKLLMSTIPVVIFVIMRYQIIIFSDKSEAPEKVLLTDKFLLGAIALWTVMVLYILYGGLSVI